MLKENFNHGLEVFEVLRNMRDTVELTPYNSMVFVYITYEALDQDIEIPQSEDNLSSFLEKTIEIESIESVKTFISGLDYTKIDFRIFKDLAAFGKEFLKDFILEVDLGSYFGRLGGTSTPPSILKYIPYIDNISDKELVADFFSGFGNSSSYLMDLGVKQLESIELISENVSIQEMKRKVMRVENSYHIVNEDVFDYFKDNNFEKFEFIFADMPWGLHLANIQPEWKSDLIETNIPKTESEWMILSLILSQLTKEGKALVTVPNRIEFSSIAQEIRKEFIEKGYIEKVIQLPSNVYSTMGIPSLLIVLSFNNEHIDFIDASEMYTKVGRQNIFTDDDIKKIMSDDFAYHKVVSLDDVWQNDRLLPSFYTVTEISNYFELSDVATIIRGQNFKKLELDNLIVNEVTGIELIRTSNLSEFSIENTQNLTDLPERYVELLDQDIIITRVGSVKSISIFEKDNDVVSIIDQSLLIIRVDRSKIDPYYLLGYFTSDLGKEQLTTAYSSGSIGQVSIKNLEKVKIPGLNTLEQQKIAERTHENVSKIKRLKFQLSYSLEELKEQTNQFFEGGF